MTLPPEAAPLLAALTATFTQPTACRFVTLLTAALLTTGRRTVANLLRTLGPLAGGHRASYQRVLSRAPWSATAVGCALAGVLLRHLLPAGPVILVGDDTVDGHPGPKVFGEGEWKVRQHGYSKRRTWRKLHLAIDAATQEVVACALTDNGTSDGAMAGPLLDAVADEIAGVKADGAYDQRPVYDAARRRGAAVVVPPRRGATIRVHGNTVGPPDLRDESVRGVRRYGRKGWKRRVGYHERSLVETGMFRYKTLFGGRLRARAIAGQRVEVRISCKIMNRFTQLGMLTARAA
jgi:hypothetical protein